jgi:hypothetical protein
MTKIMINKPLRAYNTGYKKVIADSKVHEENIKKIFDVFKKVKKNRNLSLILGWMVQD